MGLDFLREKEEAFIQRREESKRQELDTEDLISRAKSDSVVRHYRCMRTDGTVEITPGLGLIARVMSASEVVLLKHGKKIGYVLPEDVVDLTSAMVRNNHLGGVLGLIITDEPGFDNVFTVKPKKKFKK